MPGTIYLVATPLGNLEDITLRALRTLREADLIACEDTRHTRKLLARFEIHKPLISYHEHNEAECAGELVERALTGESVAVVSDAGMPGISDPGYRVVRAAIEGGVQVVPVPGPVAIEAALAASGLPIHQFRFSGFLPAKRAPRAKALKALAGDPATLVFYEAPHRILKMLSDAREQLGDRPVAVARELTKVHEEFIRGTLLEVLDVLSRRSAIKGEFTVIIAGAQGPARTEHAHGPLAERVAELMESEGLARMDAIKSAARERGLSKREAYRQLEQTT